MRQPDFSRLFILDTDASNNGSGAILMQKIEGKEHPMSYASRALTDTEKKVFYHRERDASCYLDNGALPLLPIWERV